VREPASAGALRTLMELRIFRRRLAALTGCVVALLCAHAALADIKIEVNGVDNELKRNVMALLSIARYADRQRLEADSIERLYRRVDDEVRGALKPYGYYLPTVTSAPPVLDKDRNWHLRIDIATGTPVLVNEVSVVVNGAGANDPYFTAITTALPMRKGDRLQHLQYDQIKSALQAVAGTYGYLDARMLRSELRVDTDRQRADIFLAIETGERYRFGVTTIHQDAIREQQMRRFLRYQQGEPYDANQWLRTQFALDDSRYFSTVIVTPGTPDTVNHIVPIDIQAEPARRTYSFAVGYGSDKSAISSGSSTAGAHGSVSWFNPRVNTLGHRLQLRLQASENRQSFDARYDVPFGDPALERMSLSFVAADTKSSDNVRTRELSLTPSITQVLGRWQRVLSATATHSTTRETGQDPKVFDLIVPGLTYASVPKNYLGESLLTRDLNIELLGSLEGLGAKKKFLRLHINANRDYKLSPRWHVLLRGEVGASTIKDTGDLPGQYRFFAGGDVSVRGFANGDLSPFEAQPTTALNAATGLLETTYTISIVGGRHIATGSVELVRDLPRNTGIATFVDFGNAFDHFGDPLAYSAGLGFRWRLPGVTLGIDIAKSISAPGFVIAPDKRGRLPGPRFHLNIAQRL
jgi:translocation and assembly module TamA